MSNNPFRSLLALFLFGCVAGGSEDGGLRTTSKLGPCENGAPKTAAGDSVGKVLYISQDSLAAELTAIVGCSTAFKEISSLENDSTLKIDYEYTGPSAGCICKMNVTIGVKSEKSDLRAIRQVDFNGVLYRLE
jgi:hypothetical protein